MLCRTNDKIDNEKIGCREQLEKQYTKYNMIYKNINNTKNLAFSNCLPQ